MTAALRRIGAERAAHDRVARRHRLRADHDLSRVDRKEPQFLNVERGVVADESAERPTRLRAGEHGRRLRVLRLRSRSGEERRASTKRGGAAPQSVPARDAASVPGMRGDGFSADPYFVLGFRTPSITTPSANGIVSAIRSSGPKFLVMCPLPVVSSMRLMCPGLVRT